MGFDAPKIIPYRNCRPLAKPAAGVRAPTCHFLLVTIDGSSMTVRAIGEDDHGELRDIERLDPAGGRVSGPMVAG